MTTQPAESPLVLTHVFAAPRERVFAAWTDPERVKCWWGAEHWSAPEARIDLRPGGRYVFDMRSPEGQDVWSTGTFREIAAPERLVMTDSFADEKGNVVPGSYYGMDDNWPTELLVTLTFEEVGGNTKLTLRHEGLPAGEEADMAAEGWQQSFAKLDRCLS